MTFSSSGRRLSASGSVKRFGMNLCRLRRRPWDG
jgi:hypothetical protein